MPHPLQYPKNATLFDKSNASFADGTCTTREDVVNRGSGWVTVWPLYLDASKTKTQGRKVPKRLACTSLSLSLGRSVSFVVRPGFTDASGRAIVQVT